VAKPWERNKWKNDGDAGGRRESVGSVASSICIRMLFQRFINHSIVSLVIVNLICPASAITRFAMSAV
jgi:hypothetical protein